MRIIWPGIYPTTKIPTGHTAAEGDSMHEYLSGLNFQPTDGINDE